MVPNAEPFFTISLGLVSHQLSPLSGLPQVTNLRHSKYGPAAGDPLPAAWMGPEREPALRGVFVNSSPEHVCS
jgi:hypothetical protein